MKKSYPMAAFLLIKEPAENMAQKYDKNNSGALQQDPKIKEIPESHGKPLHQPLHGYWELYFEKRFRIIHTIDLNNDIVNIEAVWHKDEF